MTMSENFSKETVEQLATIPDEEAVRRAFGTERNTPEIKVLQSGFIKSGVSYVLASGKVPHTQEDFYAVNVSTVAPGSGLDNWLVSGVFWTQHEARIIESASIAHRIPEPQTLFKVMAPVEGGSPAFSIACRAGAWP